MQALKNQLHWNDSDYLDDFLERESMVTERKNSLIRGLAPAIGEGMNVLLSGLHGIGKTFAVMQAIEDLGYEMKYYSTSTLDPYVDLVGVPVPVDRGDGKHKLEMVRPEDINNVDVVFFDELNRADPKTLNAVFELVQFRTINGEPLPRLKSVVAAINPTDGAYNTDELDPALIDRFHLFWQINPKSPAAFLKESYDPSLVDAFVLWWGNHNNSKREYYVSPRRLEYMIDIYTKFGTFEMLKHSVPPSALLDWANLKANIKIAEAGGDLGVSIANQSFTEQIQNQPFWTKKNVAANADKLREHFKANPNDALASNQFKNFLGNNPRTGMPFIKAWSDMMVERYDADPNFFEDMKKSWDSKKIRQVSNWLYHRYQDYYYGRNGVQKDQVMGDYYYKAYRGIST